MRLIVITLLILISGRDGDSVESKDNHQARSSDSDEKARLSQKHKRAIARAFASLSKKEHHDAIKGFTEAIRLNPNHIDSYNNRGICWKKVGEYQKAIDDYNKAIQLGPRQDDARSIYMNRGNAWELIGKLDKAIEDYTSSLRIKADPEVLRARGICWKKKREFKKSLSDFDEALQLDPRSVEVLYSRAILWQLLGDIDKAVAELSEALRIDPGHRASYNGRAWIYATNKDAKYRDGLKAVSDAEKACELSKYRDAGDLDTLAAAYAEVGSFAKAVKWQARAIELFKGDKSGLRQRLKLYQMGKPFRN